jgi:hypothetical protein
MINYSTSQQREILLRKAKIARMNAKYGYRRPPPADLLSYLHYQQQMMDQYGEEERPGSQAK